MPDADTRPLTLYGHTGSGSAAVEAALELIGQPWRLVAAARWAPGPGFDELLRINPLGQIPTLVWPDGTVMTESAAILIELGLRHPASGLLPAEPAARARTLRGLVWVVANAYPMIGVIDYPDRVWDSPVEAESERIQRATRAHLHRLWEAFADSFAPEASAGEGEDQAGAVAEGQGDDLPPHLGGATPDALDLLAAVVSRWGGARQHLAAHRPRLARQLARLRRHPVVGPVMQRHWPDAVD